MLNLNESYSALRGSVGVSHLPGRLLRIGGTHHRRLLSWLLARATQYAHPGTSVWSLVLDEAGQPAGSALALIDELEDLLVLDAPAEWLDAAVAAAPQDVRDYSTIETVPGFAIAVEGPRAWEAVEPLTSQPITDLLLNEVTEAVLEGEPVTLARTGVTSEFGYVVVGRGSADAALEAVGAVAARVDGGVIDPTALVRVRVETNHPIVPEQTAGLSVTEAGAAWLVSLTRDDSFYGDAVLGVTAPTRRLVAAYSRGMQFPAVGTEVTDGESVIGSVQLAAPLAGCADGLGLLLLEDPYHVPGLTLSVAGRTVETVSRPTITPLSWVRKIGVRS